MKMKMKNYSRPFGLFTLAFTMALATSMGVSSASPILQATELTSLGKAQGSGEESKELIAEIHQAENNEAGNIVSVTWSIENAGRERVVLTWLHDRSYTYSGQYFAGTTAMSDTTGTRYHPVMDSAGECLCSGNTVNDFKERLEPGEKVDYWSMFSIPDDLDTVTIEIPGFEPIEDIPIS